MAKKRKQTIEDEGRQSRKEVLLARKQARQNRQVRLTVLAIAGLLAVVLLIGVVNELILKPSSEVAVVSTAGNENGIEITMREWQDRVRFQRAQLIIGIEDLAEALGQDIGQVQQFAGQQINLLEDPETLGQLVLDQMIDEIIVREAANARGITVSEEDVQDEIERSFNYFGGASPTPFPTPTETVMPTPSLTPIPTEVITEVLPTSTPLPTATSGPTATPPPTATPVSLDAFEESFTETMDRFDDLGVDESQFRDVVRAQIYQQRLSEVLADEEDIAEEAEQASFFYIVSEDQEEAESVLDDIESDGFLDIWNAIRSEPADPDAATTLVASELLWRTRDDISNLFGDDVAERVFALDLEQPSAIITVAGEGEGESDSYYIVMVSGREVRPLSESAIAAAEQEAFQSWLENRRTVGVEIFERWRTAVPRRPILDRRFLVPPTPAPATATIAVPTLEPAPQDEGSGE